jgi:hypothetical protein
MSIQLRFGALLIVIASDSDSFPVSISILLLMGVSRLFLNGFEPQGYALIDPAASFSD